MHDNSTLIDTYTRWLEEELNELKAATTTPERLDAVFDAMGCLGALLCLHSDDEIALALSEYHEAQVRRNRPPAPWNDGIDALTSALIARHAESARLRTAGLVAVAKLAKWAGKAVSR